MTLSILRDLIDREANKALDQMLSNASSNHPLYIKVTGRSANLAGFPKEAENHRGLYGIRLSKNGMEALAYIGKTESDYRVLHHVMGVNKDGTELADTVSHQNEKVRRAIAEGFELHLCLFSDPSLEKATLSALEIACILKARSHFKQIFPNHRHWNRRVG